GELTVGPYDARLAVHGGTLALASLTVDHPSAGVLRAADVALLAGDQITLTTSAEEA
ncbi:MAG: hypothetical protein V7646_329, partial [Pseudonocardia sp.]